MMHAFFQDLNIKFSIHVIEQDDKHIFNRAKLLNIGFNLTQSNHDYFCLHDVDTIPASPCVDYSYPEKPRQLGVLIQKFGKTNTMNITLTENIRNAILKL